MAGHALMKGERRERVFWPRLWLEGVDVEDRGARAVGRGLEVVGGGCVALAVFLDSLDDDRRFRQATEGAGQGGLGQRQELFRDADQLFAVVRKVARIAGQAFGELADRDLRASAAHGHEGAAREM